MPVARESPFGKDRLRHSGGRRHRDVALEDLAIERIAGVAADEGGAHRAHERLERPDSRPLADGIGKSRLFGSQISDKDVVHVAAVVHQEDDRGLGWNRGEPFLVRIAQPYSVERARDVAGERVADAKVGVGVEGGDDLACITAYARENDLARHAAGFHLRLDRLLHLRVEDQTIDQDLPLRQGQRRNPDLQPRVDLLEDFVDAPAHEPAKRRKKQAVQRRPESEQGDRHRQPDWERQVDSAAHAAKFSDSLGVNSRVRLSSMLCAPALRHSPAGPRGGPTVTWGKSSSPPLAKSVRGRVV